MPPLHNGIYGSKDILEEKLGIKILAFAFLTGLTMKWSAKWLWRPGTRRCSLYTASIWESMLLPISLAATPWSRGHPDVLQMAVNFGNNDGVAPGVEAAQLASVAMVTQPMNEEKILDTRPVIKANLASMVR